MKITTLNITVPTEILLVLRENETTMASYMKKYTALNLYQNRKLSIGQCAELAEMSEEDFIYFLGKHEISIFDYHDKNSLQEELKHE